MILSTVTVKILIKNSIGGGLAVVLDENGYHKCEVGFSKFEGKDVREGETWKARLNHGHYKTLDFLAKI